MPKYPKTNATAKVGVNYVRTIVEHHNCIFQKIDQENDVGIDALIELVKNEIPTGSFVAVQIKSGNSYFDKQSNLCKIPIKSHREYWQNYSMPVYGLVYIPEFENAYWVNIKEYLKRRPSDAVISFESNLVNTLNKKTFITQFIPYLTGEVPELDFEHATKLFKSKNQDEMYLGLYILFKKYADKNEVWKLFVDYFQNKSPNDIPGKLVYYLSVIPWHPDIFFFKDSYTTGSRKFGRTLIEKFDKSDVVKLLSFVDQENMISRGSLGQSVEAIISIVPGFLKYLEEIIKDKSFELQIREAAAVIYAYHVGSDSTRILPTLASESWYIQEVLHHINEYGGFNPYM